MDCLHKETRKFSFEEYRKFNYALIRKRHAWVIIFGLCLFFLLAGIFLKETWAIIFAIIYPFVFWGFSEFQIRKVYRSNKFYQDSEIQNELYDTYLVQTTENGSIKIPYDKLNEVIETKTNFYLMIAKNQGIILSKEDMSAECQELIRKLIKK